jgi:hypothetical protein
MQRKSEMYPARRVSLAGSNVATSNASNPCSSPQDDPYLFVGWAYRCLHVPPQRSGPAAVELHHNMLNLAYCVFRPS